MIAIDTNVLVRTLTADDPEQVALARKVLRSESIWISKTVILETEWVLRFTYKISSRGILDSFRSVLGYRQFEFEDRGGLVRALSLLESGLDFADALHLTSCPRAERFVTFDRKLAQKAALAEIEGLPRVECLEARKR